MSKIESFEVDMPQLNRSKTVWVYLPDNYSTTGAPSPVIYMQDGQNLFYDKLTEYGRAWHVDKALDDLYATGGLSAIVIGVECNDKRRLSEYSPWKISPFAYQQKRTVAKGCNRGGEGKLYAEFFAKTLKPIVDSRYNTDKEREATAVAGGNMGGLISCFLGLTYQRIYETIGLFSPNTFFNQGAFNRFVKNTPQTLQQHALVYCGGKEGLDKVAGEKRLKSSIELYNTLAKRGLECELVVNSAMMHGEQAWETYFRKFAHDFLWRYRLSKTKSMGGETDLPTNR